MFKRRNGEEPRKPKAIDVPDGVRLSPKRDLINGDVVRIGGKTYICGPRGNLVRLDKGSRKA